MNEARETSERLRMLRKKEQLEQELRGIITPIYFR